MCEDFFSSLGCLRENLWSYIGLPAIILLGIYLSFKSNFFQIRKFPLVVRRFFSYLRPMEEPHRGIHPLGAFWTCLGGCVGIGNVVAISGAVQIGGPGALFWVWVTAILGMALKYSEVYLGMRYRIKNSEGGYNGGPMYYLSRIFKTSFVPNLLALLLVFYGVEIYQFTVMNHSISTNFNLDYTTVTIAMLVLVIITASGGIKRVAHVSSAVVPLFIVFYIGMSLWIVCQHLSSLPEILMTVFQSAFTGHAAVGGFIGSTILVTATQGIAQACYSSDVGIGYASVIHSESSVISPTKQASLILLDIFIDTFIVCTMSILLVLVTGMWKQPIHESLLVQNALSLYYPYMHIFMPFFLFLLGYSTIIAFFYVGEKCAVFLSPKYGRTAFFIYAISVLLIFSYAETRQTFALMSLVGVLLLFINLYGIFRMRKDISFDVD